jgi:hypothetical protein
MSNNRYPILIGGLVILAGVVALSVLPLSLPSAPAAVVSPPVVVTGNELPLFTQAREVSVGISESGIAGDIAVEHRTFTGAREQSYAMQAAPMSTFTGAREASGFILEENADQGIMAHHLTFTQAREDAVPAINADAARLTGLAEFYKKPSAVDASAARYVAMGEFYTAQAEARQRAINADAARLTALAEYYQ